MAKLNSGTRIYGNVTVDTFATITGNVAAGNLSGTNIVGTLTTAAQPNITSVGTLSSLAVTGNITSGNLSGTSIVGTLTTAAQTNITSVGTLTSLAVTGNITSGNLSGTSIVGTLTTAAQPNITSVGTLTSLAVTGNITSGNVQGTTHSGTTGTFSGNVTTGNVSGTTGTFTNVGGTLTTAAQTNITSVGTLTSLAVTGNITSGNVQGTTVSGTTGTFGGNITVGGWTTTNGIIVTPINLDPGGINIATLGGGASASGRTLMGWNRSSGGGEFDIINNPDGGSPGGVSFYNWANTAIATTNLIFNVQGTTGNVVVYGNIVNGMSNTVGNVGSSASYFNTVFASNLTGTLTTAAQTNITSVGTLTSLAVTGNITSGNVQGTTHSGTTGTFTGNLTGGNILGNGQNLTGLNAFSTIAVSGQNNLLANSTASTLTLSGGNSIIITTDNTTNTVTVAYGAGIFTSGGDMGLVTEAVVTAQDLGLVTSPVTTSYDLGSVVTNVTYNQIDMITPTGNINAVNINVTGNMYQNGNLYATQIQAMMYALAF